MSGPYDFRQTAELEPKSISLCGSTRHAVLVVGPLPVDVMSSDWDCTLEGLLHPPAVRLGLRLVVGLKAESALRILKARSERPFDGAEDLARRAEIEQHEMTLLAAADALMSLAGHRRQQVWEAAGQRSAPQLLKHAPVNEEELELPAAPEGEEVVWDYAATGLTLRRHPLAILRPVPANQGWCTAAELHGRPAGASLRHRDGAAAA